MTDMPTARYPDSTLPLLRAGYAFIPDRSRRLGSDVFRTRILLRETICMTGEESARVFYDPARFQRDGAAPERLKKTLFGQGGVQGLDGEAHRCRKAMFMSLMTPGKRAELRSLFEERWREAVARWSSQEEVVLFSAAEEVLCRAVCAWAGVPLPEAEVEERTRQLSAMIDGAGAVGPRHWRGRRARTKAERWVTEQIEAVRSGTLEAPEGRALRVVALHEEPDGTRLDPHVAAVELLNVLRPTVAIARYIAFLAHALHEHPEARAALESGAAAERRGGAETGGPAADDGGAGDADASSSSDEARWRFVQEVRRLYPFFPFAAAVVRESFEWRGYRFEQGTRVLLDLYGTSRDGRSWKDPERFRPDRYVEHEPTPFDLIPQGGGDHERNHRCAGEWVTIDLMEVALSQLVDGMRYEVPPQDLSIDLSRIPAIPASRVVLRKVEPV